MPGMMWDPRRVPNHVGLGPRWRWAATNFPAPAGARGVSIPDLALAVGLRAALVEARVHVDGAQERVSRAEVIALAPAPGLGLDAVEELVGDDVAHVHTAAAAIGARDGLATSTAVVIGRAAVTGLVAAVA